MDPREHDNEANTSGRRADEKGRSVQEGARQAIELDTSHRSESLRAAIERVRTEDAGLLDRLSP
jgi:hypothetical protein